MKDGQFLEYDLRNIFYKKSYTKYHRETIPRPIFFLRETVPDRYLWINNLKLYTVCFYFMSGLHIGIIETKLQTTCFYFK